MPYVNVRLAGGISAETKRDLIAKITNAVTEATGKSPSATYVVIDEVDPDNWGVSGQSLSDRRKG